MSKSIPLGHIDGLFVKAKPNAFYTFALLWAALSAAGISLLKLSTGTGIVAGFAGTALHYASEGWHHISHARAARKTGYPMEGFVLVWALAVGRYPKDEPELPAEIHIRRALGGPIGSFWLTLAAGALAWALQPFGGAIWYPAVFLFLDNLLVFALGSFLPLGFTDGSTLLYWWPRRKGIRDRGREVGRSGSPDVKMSEVQSLKSEFPTSYWAKWWVSIWMQMQHPTRPAGRSG